MQLKLTLPSTHHPPPFTLHTQPSFFLPFSYLVVGPSLSLSLSILLFLSYFSISFWSIRILPCSPLPFSFAPPTFFSLSLMCIFFPFYYYYYFRIILPFFPFLSLSLSFFFFLIRKCQKQDLHKNAVYLFAKVLR